MNRLRLAFWGLVISAGLCLGAGSLSAGEAAGVIHDSHWSIEIRPASQTESSVDQPSGTKVVPVVYQEPAPIGPALPPNAPAELDTPAAIPSARMSYVEAYASVPFSRTEYDANPGYRHLAALELMFGVQRPMTTVQHYTPRASRFGDTYQIPYGRSETQHINIRSFGNGYFNGQSPFGYPYGLKGNW